MITLKSIFGSDQAKAPSQNAIPMPPNPNNRQEGETYHHWGLRVCAIADGNHLTLVPYLHNVFNYIQREQIANQALQDEQHNKLQGQIEQRRNDIKALNDNLNECKRKQEEKKERIAELKDEKKDLRNKAYEVNKDAKLKMILGLMVLIPLTFYLFLFYSSTFYSAFFKNFGANADVLNSMFDAHALSNAWNDSIPEFLFILSAPIIFLGLGFSLHFFSVQTTWTKYLKMMAIVVITFVFDCILAYMIGKQLHNIAIIIGAADLNSAYGLAEAVADINTWAVIFCGFVVYIIWGIVFDMTMSAYDQLDLNSINLKALDEQMKALTHEIEEEKAKEPGINEQIHKFNNEIADLTNRLSQKVILDTNAIRTEMTNFFTGWADQMNVLGKTQREKEVAIGTFDRIVQELLS